jgi:uncharacterized protein involved in response to NO
MKNHYFLSQPHQPFFVLGFINALLSMFIFMLLFKGALLSEISPRDYHAYSLIYLLFTPAFLAFIFTTYPRFSATPPIERVVYLTILVPFVLGTILVFLGVTLLPTLMSIGMVITLIGHLLSINILRKIHNASPITDKHDIFWILMAMGFGGLSHLLFLIGYLWEIPTVSNIAIQIGIYLYLFLVTFSVAQRMVPFFSNCFIERDDNLLKTITLLLAGRILLESIQPHLSFIADFALMYLVGVHLISWDLPFPNPNPLLWILHLALFWVPIAFLLSGLSSVVAIITKSDMLFLDIHLLVLGFILTILIGFGTRVTLGHSGNKLVADRWTTILFYWTQLVVLTRIMTSLITALGWNFLFWFDISITVWMVLFGIWASRFFGMLIFEKEPE